MRSGAGFPFLRVLGGALLVLAGVTAYYGTRLGASAILILVGGGAVVLVAALLGHRSKPLDICIFILGVLVLGGVTAGYSGGTQLATYTATRAQVQANVVSIGVSSSASSVSLVFTNRTDVAYQVEFTRPSWVWPFAGPGTDKVSNSTDGGVFHLDISTTWSSVSVLLGKGYVFDVDASTGTGSIDMQAQGVALGNVTLHSSTGSVSALIDSPGIESLRLQADTGSVSLVSHRLGAGGTSVPVTLTTSTGSVSARLSLGNEDAVTLSATTSLGSISHDLSGFTITQSTNTNLAATAGDMQAAHGSFEISASAGLGSVSLNIGFV